MPNPIPCVCEIIAYAHNITIAELVIGLFVPALAYLSYKGRVNLKWITIETH